MAYQASTRLRPPGGEEDRFPSESVSARAPLLGQQAGGKESLSSKFPRGQASLKQSFVSQGASALVHGCSKAALTALRLCKRFPKAAVLSLLLLTALCTVMVHWRPIRTAGAYYSRPLWDSAPESFRVRVEVTSVLCC